MDKERIKSIIKDQLEVMRGILKTERIIGRDVDASRYMVSNTALFILGVRRCGKSVLAMQLFGNADFGYVNFDDERFIGMRASDLNTVLQALYEISGSDLQNLVLDEIQNVDGWEKFVSRLRDTKRVIVTGSNSKLLSGELATSMTGRHVDLTLYPFSFREFLRYNGTEMQDTPSTLERARINSLFDEYAQGGGFPEFFKYGRAILSSIYNDIITKDIVLRHRIKRVNELRNLASYMISNSSQEYTYSSLKSITHVRNQITITNWIGYMEEAYMIFSLKKFSFKLKEVMIAPRKVYAIDTGMANMLGFRSDENRSRLMETMVALELKRRSENFGYKYFEFYYWKDYRQREVDFVIKEGKSVKQLIQVTYVSGRDEINKREIENLLVASDELRCRELLVITKDYEGREEFQDKEITFIPIWKWLGRA